MKSVTHIRSVFSQVTWSTNSSTLYYYSTMHTLASTMWYEVQCPWLFTTLVGVYTLEYWYCILLLYILYMMYIQKMGII